MLGCSAASCGYGMALFGGGFTGTPNVGFGLSDTEVAASRALARVVRGQFS